MKLPQQENQSFVGNLKSMTSKWRLLITPPSDAFYNMALDEALFLSYQDHKTPTLRIYSWEKPSITLGYSQEYDNVINDEFVKNDNVAVVRRITGGQAIVHDNELTYSLVASLEDIEAAKTVKDSYRIICSCLIDAYKKCGLDAMFSYQSPERNYDRLKANLCFSSREDYDILVNGKKLGGNAQKRKKELLLQHGSIPFSISQISFDKYVNESNNTPSDCSGSLNELMDRKIDFAMLSNFIVESFGEKFKFESGSTTLTKIENDYLEMLLKTKYKLDTWNRLR